MAVTSPTTDTTSVQYGRSERAARRKVNLQGWGFILPFMVAYGLFLIWPVLLGLRMSFYNWSLASTGTAQFLGLDNYAEMFGEPAVWSSLWHTIYFTLLSTPPLVIIGLIMALLTNRKVPGRWFFRLAFFAPFVLPVSVVALIWVWMYQPGFGLVNSWLNSLGLPDVGWLTDPNVAMISIVITTVWWTVGLNFLLYLAGLQGIPKVLYEAADIDGATGWQKLRYVTLPQLKQTTLLVIALQILASLKVFDQIYLMTQGGPNFATRPIIQYIYETGFTNYRVGLASAVSYFFFAIILVASILQFSATRSREAQ